MASAHHKLANGARRIDFQTDPARYRHWKLNVEGPVATLLMDVDERGGLFEGYDRRGMAQQEWRAVLDRRGHAGLRVRHSAEFASVVPDQDHRRS